KARAAESLRFTALDHLEFTVSDLAKSISFYARVFGNEVYKNKRAEKRYLKLGPTYLGIDRGQAPLRVDHYCIGIAGFDIASLHSFLTERGVAYKDYPSGRDLYVADPDGIRTQLATENSWNTLAPNTVEPESHPIQGNPIFRPTGMDHIL